jgi:hypothetical protein
VSIKATETLVDSIDVFVNSFISASVCFGGSLRFEKIFFNYPQPWVFFHSHWSNTSHRSPEIGNTRSSSKPLVVPRRLESVSIDEDMEIGQPSVEICSWAFN